MENLEEAANALLETALNNGGRDNISLVLLEDLEGPGGQETAHEAEELEDTPGEVTP